MYASVAAQGEQAIEQDRRLGLGRVLVWLMAPVAAEQMKYGELHAEE